MISRRALAGVFGVGFSAAAAAQPAGFPDRPVRLVLPYSPGGSVDLLARAFGQRFTRHTGQPTVVENRPGASATLAAQYVARADPDGYTLLSGGTQLALMRYLGTQTTYDAERDLAPIAILALLPYVLVVRASLPVHSVRELIDYAKAHPGQLSYASTGVGGTGHLAAEMFNTLAGTETLHVPYSGTAPGLNDVMAGRVDMSFCTVPPAIPGIQAGRLRAIALTGTQTMRILPGLPTVAMAGIADYDCISMNLLFAPSATPADRMARLNAAATAALRDQEFRALLEDQGFIPAEPMDLTRSKASFEASVAKMVTVIERAHIRA
ncbi:MAG TPA: tripartite tricarboxylate transporter substrate-binding protein [Roseomonas sp.]|jgi:tripartite-type tricarboxylate transporter receptor subunit TctC